MTKPLFMVLMLIGIMTSIYAQTTSKTLPDGGTETTTVTTEKVDFYPKTTTKVVTRNADGSLRESKTTIAFTDFVVSETDSLFGPGDKVRRVTVVQKKNAKDTTYKEEANFNKDGVIVESQIREYSDNGRMRIRWYRHGSNSFDRRDKDQDPGPLPVREPEPVAAVPNPNGTPGIGLKAKYSNTLSASLGYSYLKAGSGEDKISFPVGGQLEFTLMLTRNIGLIADASYHTKKENDARIARLFLLGGMQYAFLRIQQKRQQELILLVRLMAGLAKDRQKYSFGPYTDVSTDKAFAYAVGLALAYPLTSTLYLQIIPDYIRTRFNDETIGSLRVSAGVKLDLNPWHRAYDSDSRHNY